MVESNRSESQTCGVASVYTHLHRHVKMEPNITNTHTHTLTHTQRERRQMPVVDEGEFTKTRCPFVVSGGGSSRFGADKMGAWLTAFRITPHTGLPRLLLVMS